MFPSPYDRLAHHQQTQHLMLQPFTSWESAIAVQLFRPLLLCVWVGMVQLQNARNL